ncbi:MAG: FAD-dependent monooxygenase [Pseudomonadota bacterium]
MISNAIVVGGGIGGLCAAALLARTGVAVTLLERAEQIREVGAGLQVSPNGLAVLQALGLEEQLVWSGALRARAVVLSDYRRSGTVARLDLTRLEPLRYYFVHRADLIGLLLREARKSGVAVELGQTVTDVQPGEPARLTLESGETRRAELIVCADGLHSVGRTRLNEGGAAQFTGQVAWRAVVPVEDFRPEAHVTMAPGRHMVSYPVQDGSAMNLVAVQERKDWAAEGWSHEDHPDHLRAAFADYRGYAASLLKQVEKVHLWGLFRHPVAQRWTADGLAILGDAAHPTLPFLAQGANLALEDAYVLSDTVAKDAPLAQYETARRARALRVIEAANGNAWKYHLPHGPTRIAAHSALKVASWLAPGLMMRQFKWLYGYDVRKVCALAD